MPTCRPLSITVLALAYSVAVPALVAQQGGAVLHAPLAVLPVDGPPFQALGDFDGDGDLDAVGTRIHQNRSNNEIIVWENQGGGFSPVWTAAFPLGPIGGPAPRSFAVAVADFDGNGRDDFVVGGGVGTVRYLAGPNFTFTTSSQSVTGIPYAHAVDTGDFDGDPLPDVAFTYTDYLGRIQLCLERSTGGPLTLPLIYNPAAVLRVSALELNGAAGDEVLISDRNSQAAWICAVVGNQLVLQQTLATSLSYNGGTPWLWMGGDLDGDLDDDLVVFKPETGTNGIPHYEIFRRTGAAMFTAEPQQIGGPAEYLADVDGDGDLDGVCCGGGGGPNYVWPELDFASTFEIAPNLGGGNFARAWQFPGAGSESMAGAADVDGDGDIDFVAGRCIYYGRGPWREHPMPVGGGDSIMIVGRPGHLTDVDRDGDIDFWGRNQGDGSMQYHFQHVPPPAGHLFSGRIDVDVDGDGARDQIVQYYRTNVPFPPTFLHMAMLQNNGGGHFRHAGQVAPGGLVFGPPGYAFTADSYRAADCDGDGDEDVVWTSNPASGQGYHCQIYWNQNGTFAAGPALTSSTGGRIDAVADFDGDNLPDLLTSTPTATHVLRGTGNAAQPFQIVWTGPAMPFEPAAVTIGDFDDDGRRDFARPNHLGEIVLFVNTTPPGAGLQFAASPLLDARIIVNGTTLASAVRSTLTSGDFDGDGRTDLAVGRIPGEPNIGLVLRRTGSASPPTMADYEVARQALVDGFACDVDGDGDTDLLGQHAVYSPRFHGRAGGRRVQRHAGIAGEAGAVPVLGGTGPYRAHHTDVMRLTGVPGPSLALLGLSLREVELVDVPLAGLTLRVDPTLLYVAWWPITTDGQDRAAAMTLLPSYIVPEFAGLTFYAQAFVVDPAAPSGFSQSNLLEKRIGW